MKAALYKEFGPPEVLRYEEVEDPVAGPGEIVVEVHAVTVNRVLDCAVRAGTETQRGVVLPHIGGVDPAGVVHQVGEGVAEVSAGDRVALLSRAPCLECDQCKAGEFKKCPKSTMLGVGRWGGAAEFVKVPASVAVKLPDNLQFAEAAAVMRHGPMAHYLLFDAGDLQPGETVLVMGAAGGLGLAGIQIAKAAGAKVIAAAGSDERVAVGYDYGAEFGVNYVKEDLTKTVLDYMGGEGVHLVFENISNPNTWPKALKCLRKFGRLVTAGAHGGGKVELDCAFLYHENIRIFGCTGNTEKNVGDTVSLAGDGRLRAKIEKVFPLSEATEAHRMMESDILSGKIILDPRAG